MIQRWIFLKKTFARLRIWQYIIISLAGIIIFSCSKDHDLPEPPEVNFLKGEYTPENLKRVSQDTVLYQGAKFVFGVNVISKSEKNLSKILITRKYESSASKKILDTILNATTFTGDFVVNASNQDPGMEIFEITARDINNHSTSVSFTVTTIETDPGISLFQDIHLGSFQSGIYDNGFSTFTGETFNLIDVNATTAEQERIDWVYFRSETYGHSFMSPANSVTEIWYPQIKDWSARKRTSFAKTNLKVTDFNSIDTDLVLVQTIQNLNLDMTKDFYSEKISTPGGISENLVIAFINEENKCGLILVKAISGGSVIGTSNIVFDIKVVK